jgi:formylmethanofuran:tetrahydromethanopterin formyltransferase
MARITDLLGRGQEKWLGERSLIVFPAPFADFEREARLGCARCLLWGLMFEVGRACGPALLVGVAEIRSIRQVARWFCLSCTGCR